MSKSRYGLWAILVGVLIAAMTISPDLWAAPGQSPARQTVPTKTPEGPATPEPTSPPPTSKPNKPRPTATPEPPPATPSAPPAVTAFDGESTPLLPGAGGPSVHLPLGVATIIAGLLAIMAVRRLA
jgi:hypothetical protein